VVSGVTAKRYIAVPANGERVVRIETARKRKVAGYRVACCVSLRSTCQAVGSNAIVDSGVADNWQIPLRKRATLTTVRKVTKNIRGKYQIIPLGSAEKIAAITWLPL